MYSDLTDERNWPSSLTQVLQTREGVVKEGSSHLPNALCVKLSCSPAARASSHSSGVSVNVERPVKVSCGPVLLKECTDTFLSFSNGFQGNRGARSHDRGAGRDGKPKALKLEGISHEESSTASICTDIEFSTRQVVWEFLQTVQKVAEETPGGSRFTTDATGGSKLATGVAGGSEVAGEAITGEGICSPDPSVVKEGVIVSWDKLKLSFTSREAKESSAKMAGSGLQLLCVCAGCPGYLVPPTVLECSLTKHTPSSALDMSVPAPALDMYVHPIQ